MKTNSLSINSLNRSKSFEYQLNTATDSCTRKHVSIPALLGFVAMFLLFVHFNANAQTPASSITGPLYAYVNDSNLVITSQIVSNDPSPVITYTLSSNTSGASIASQGVFKYDTTTGTGSQSIKIKAGSGKGSFTVDLQVNSIGGVCKASKSVTVITNSNGNGNGNGHGH